MMTRPHRYLDRLIALSVGLIAFALYLRTLAPGLLWGDSAEFQFSAWLGGFAHPTGYPLYLMLGWLWTHLLPLGDPAWRMNLFSAVCAAAAVGLVHLVALRCVRRLLPGAGWLSARLLASGAALAFAVTPTFWSQALVAEVYTLHAALVAAILLVALDWAEAPRGSASGAGWPRLYLLAGLVGLGLAHHRTTLLLLPGLAAFMWLSKPPQGGGSAPGPARQRPPAGTWRRLAGAAALGAAPLLLYAYIPLVAPHVPYFAITLGPGQSLPLYDRTLQGFLAHISGSVFQSALAAPRGPWLAEFAARLSGELTWPGVALGLLGAGWLAWRDRRLLALTGLTLAATVGFNAVYGIGDIHVFFIPAYLVWATWLAAGGVALRGLARRPGAAAGLPAAALLALAAWLLVVNFAPVDRSADHTARIQWEGLLAQDIPQGAILVTNDRDEMVPQWYLKYVEGRRGDLDGLFPLLRPGPAWADAAAVIEQGLASGRPVYLIKPMPGLEVKFEMAPASAARGGGIGALVRVHAAVTRSAPPVGREIAFAGQLRLAGYAVQSQAVRPGQAVEVALEWEPLAPLVHDYTSFVHLVNAEGRTIGQSDQRPGGVYYPTSQWRAGDLLRDVHRFTVAEDPGPAPYTLRVGLYRLAPDLLHLGEPQEIGALDAGNP